MVSGSDFSEIDGPVLHFYSLFKALNTLNPGIEAYAPYRTTKPEFSGIHFLPGHLPGMFASLEFQLRVCWKIFSTCLSQKPDCLYIRSQYAMFAPWVLSFLLRIPMVTEFEDYKRPRWVLALGKIIEQGLARRSAAVIAITQGVKEWMIKNYSLVPERIYVIANAADPDRFHPEYQPELRRQYQLDQNLFIAAFVGSLTWWQGVSFFIEAIPLVEKKMKDWKVLIIGDGTESQGLAKLAEKLHLGARVFFAGKVSAAEAAKYMQISDVLVLPKVPIECSPLKLYEYMAAGRPVVSSDLAGFEIVRESGGGILVPPENPQAIAEALLQLYALTPEQRREMGLRGRQEILKNYTWDAAAEKTLNIIRKIKPDA